MWAEGQRDETRRGGLASKASILIAPEVQRYSPPLSFSTSLRCGRGRTGERDGVAIAAQWFIHFLTRPGGEGKSRA